MTYSVTPYAMHMAGLTAPVRLSVVADFHNGDDAAALAALEEIAPQAVLLPGDFLHKAGAVERGFRLLSGCAARYPTFCSLGNHETKSGIPDLAARIADTGAHLLDNAACRFGELLLGGLSTGYAPGIVQKRTSPTPPPDREFLAEFAREKGARVLLCHHPEYYAPYIRETDIPLTVSGHAHGGQWVFFGRAIFSPGQGLLPRYTAGLYEGRLLVSRGLGGGPAFVPRIGNPREILTVDLLPT